MSKLADLLAPEVEPGDARVRWGVLWFLALMAALWVDARAAAPVLGAVAVIGAWHAAATLGPHRVLAVAVTAAAVAASAVDTQLVGVVIVAATLGTVVVAIFGRSGDSVIARAGVVLAAWLLPTAAAASVVVTARRELGAAVILVWIAGMYDAGSYLVGSEARSRWLGPLAGAVGIVAVVYTAVQLAVPPLEPDTAWRYAALTLVTVPLGPLVARVFLVRDGWAIHRLDTLIVAGPAWAWAIG